MDSLFSFSKIFYSLLIKQATKLVIYANYITLGCPNALSCLEIMEKPFLHTKDQGKPCIKNN